MNLRTDFRTPITVSGKRGRTTHKVALRQKSRRAFPDQAD